MWIQITKWPEKWERLNVQVNAWWVHRVSFYSWTWLFLSEFLANKLRQVADILDDKRTAKEQVETKNTILELEDENFRIPSEWWNEVIKNWIKVKENPEWDIWDYLWEQYFTQEAMEREIQKYWETVPLIK